MRFGIKVINQYDNVNSFYYGTEWMIRTGDTKNLYFQLVNLDSADEIRHMLASGSSVTLTFPNLGSAAVVKSALQADPLDSSIWYVSIVATDVIATGSVFFDVVEGGISSKFGVSQAINVENSDVGNPNWGGC